MTSSRDNNTVINTKQMVFSHLFYEGRFEVPWHQRRYDWTKEHVRELLQDIDEAIKENRRCYFLGAIILIEKGTKVWEINDGQQRMMTFSLICACLSRLFHRTNEQIHENHALRVLFDLDVNNTVRLSDTDKLKPRLTPSRDDKTRYDLMIRGSSLGTNGKLTDAWKEIDQFVSGMRIGQSKRFMDFLLNKIEVACLHIPNDVDPNSVFETINCRGKRLEDLDLIRNYLYSYFNAPEEQSRRDTVHDNLENVRIQLRSDTKAGEYARCYFQCEYGFLPKQSFYRKTRDTIRSRIDTKNPADYVYRLVSDFSLQKRVALFETIANASTTNAFAERFQSHSNSNRKKRNLAIFLQELKAYKVAQPMIFALLNRYIMEADTAKKRRLAKRVHTELNRITSFILRTALVAPKFEPSHFEKDFSNLAKTITSANEIYDVNVMSFLKKFDAPYGIIDDDKFIEAMKTVKMRNGDRRVKRFLLSVNHSMQSDRNLINEHLCSVEHILPRSEEYWLNWKNFNDCDPEDWVHRIGNLTLLGQEDNKPGKSVNMQFSKKKEIFDQSAIKITRELGYEDWSPSAITARQEKMANLAAKKVWTFKLLQRQ